MTFFVEKEGIIMVFIILNTKKSVLGIFILGPVIIRYLLCRNQEQEYEADIFIKVINK